MIIVQAVVGSCGGYAVVDVEDLKAVLHLVLYEMGSALVTLVCVLVKDGVMMLTWVFAALHQHENQAVEL